MKLLAMSLVVFGLTVTSVFASSRSLLKHEEVNQIIRTLSWMEQENQFRVSRQYLEELFDTDIQVFGDEIEWTPTKSSSTSHVDAYQNSQTLF